MIQFVPSSKRIALTACLPWLAIPVISTTGQSPSDSPHFQTQIVPVLTRSGCNAGACHGAAAGRGGFSLSLLGSNPSADFQAIVHALEGRRVNRAHADRSLLLRKPSGYLDHGGDVALPEESPQFDLVRCWIEGGVQRGSDKSIQTFELKSSALTVESAGESISLRALVAFDNEPPIDVTHLTTFSAVDSSAVELDAVRATVRLLRPGQHLVIARYLNQVRTVQLMLPVEREPVQFGESSDHNFIDAHIDRVLGRMRLQPASQVDDAVFLRRVTLDLTGCLPRPHDVDAFLNDRRIDKRQRWVDRLLSSVAFTDYWTLCLARQLHLHSLPNEPQATRAFADWIRASVADGLPWHQMTHQLLTSQGDSHRVGAANFARMAGDARQHAELVANALLGVRLACANCHDHPLDRWTQDDYHGLAAVFARLDRSRIVTMSTRGEVTHPRTHRPAGLRLPGVRFLAQTEAPLNALSDWMLAPGHPLLARAMTNRLWAAMFGRGLVWANDDLRDTNPASHPELFDQLSASFVDHDYDIRYVLRLIAGSAAYARESSSDFDPFLATTFIRRLRPEVLCDAIADVCDVQLPWEALAPGMRAVHLLDPHAPAASLDALGRCARQGACGDDGQFSASLTADLHLINGPLINVAINHEDGFLQRQLDADLGTRQIIEELYRRAFSRLPTGREIEYWNSRLTASSPEERREQLQDFMWSLLASQRFQTNH